MTSPAPAPVIAGGRLAPASAEEVHGRQRPDVSPRHERPTARCFGCRNRCRLCQPRRPGSGVLCCRRCWESREVLETPIRTGRRGDRGMSASEQPLRRDLGVARGARQAVVPPLLLTAAGLGPEPRHNDPRVEPAQEVIRIGCDGIPQVVTLDSAAYSEPNEREIRAFATESSPSSTPGATRSPSSTTWSGAPTGWRRSCASASSAASAGRPRPRDHPGDREARSGGPRSIPATLEIQVDKRPYPWKVKVKGVRQVVSDTGPGRELRARAGPGACLARGTPGGPPGLGHPRQG